MPAGQLHPGDQLITIREWAADLRVNDNTVARAYLDLDRDGVIATQFPPPSQGGGPGG